MYGKIVNNKVVYAPENYIKGDGSMIANFNENPTAMAQYGYKELNEDIPKDFDSTKQYLYIDSYTENDTSLYITYIAKDKEVTTGSTSSTTIINSVDIDDNNISKDKTFSSYHIDNVYAKKDEMPDTSKIENRIDNLEANTASITDLYVQNEKIDKLQNNIANINTANIGTANIDTGNVTDLTAVNANIKNLQSEYSEIKELINGHLTSKNIESLIITGDKFTVDNGFIKDAMIESVSADKLLVGTINTNLIKLSSEDGSMLIDGNLQQFKDENGNVRIQIGKDNTNNFTFTLYDKTGKGVLINENGIKESAISDGLIVNKMIADNANISGGKIDVASLITKINDDNSKTISGSKIKFDDSGQTLDVEFNTLKTKVETISTVSADGDLSSVIDQVSSNTTAIKVNKNNIDTLISNTTITKSDGTVIQMKDDYNSTKRTLDSMNQTIASNSTDIDSLNTENETIKSNISSITQTVGEVNSNISQINTKLKNDYSTTESMNTAIKQSADAISTTVSQVYTTKEQFNNLVVGGRNLIVNSSTLDGKFNTSGGFAGTITYVDDSTAKSGKYIQVKCTKASSSGGCYFSIFPKTSDKIGKIYTWSCCVKCSSNKTLSIGHECDGTKTVNATTEWQKVTNTWIFSNGQYESFVFYVTNNSSWDYGDILYIKDFKIEEGSLSTDYSEAPEDLQGKVNSISSKTSSIEQTANKINLLVKDGSTSSSLLLTDSLFSAIAKNIKLTADNITLEGLITANSNFKINSDGSITTQNATITGKITGSNIEGTTITGTDITGSTFSSANNFFEVLKDGTVQAKFLSIDGEISTSILNVEHINNSKYQEVVNNDMTISINPSLANSEVFENNSTYSSFNAFINNCPRNLNGYTVTINLYNDTTEDIHFNKQVSGVLLINLNGHTIHGNTYFDSQSTTFEIYGNNSNSTGSTVGSIMPNKGISSTGGYYSLLCSYSNLVAYDLKIYAGKTDGNNNGIKVSNLSKAFLSNIQFVDCYSAIKLYANSQAYVSSSSGVTSGVTFTSSGSILILNSNNQAGRNGSTTYTSTSNNGQIYYSGATFSGTTVSGSNTTDTTTTVATTQTLTSDYGDTYRLTVYNNWKKDGTVRCGDYGYGDCVGCFFFGSDFSKFVNSNISKVTITVKRQAGGVNASHEHLLKMHNYSSRPSGSPTYRNDFAKSFSVAVGDSVTITLSEASEIDAFKKCAGFGIIPQKQDSSHYSVFSGTCTVKVYCS